MKTRKIYLTFLILLAGLLFTLTACKKSNTFTPQSSVLKVNAVGYKSGTSLGPIPVTGGVLNLATALVNIGNVQIEENSGNDVQQTGENGSDGGNDNGGGSEGGGSESDNSDIYLAGPFGLDISSGQASIGQVSVYPGTFKKVNFSFQPSSTEGFNGQSIVVTGQYNITGGGSIPFTINSLYSLHIQSPLANNGVTVLNNSTVDISIVFDLTAWLSDLDFANAQVTNGNILIDANNNTNLLSAFEAYLSANIDVEGE
jgi:hypothetical protein